MPAAPPGDMIRRAMAATKLTDVLSPGDVEIGFSCRDVADAVERLLGPRLSREGWDPPAVAAAVDAVKRREENASTLMGALALPHGRLAGLSRIVGALGVNPGGVFPEGEDGPRLVLVFASPEKATSDHLRFLASVARTLRSQELVDEALDASSPEALLATIRRREKDAG